MTVSLGFSGTMGMVYKYLVLVKIELVGII